MKPYSDAPDYGSVLPVGALATYRAVRDHNVKVKILGEPQWSETGIVVPCRVMADCGPWRRGEQADFNPVWLRIRRRGFCACDPEPG